MNVLKWRQQIQRDLHKSLNLDHPEFAEYCQFYGLTHLDCQVELLKLKSPDGQKAKKGWVFWHFSQRTPVSRGYALVNHGLFDHSAYMRPLIESLLAKGLNVLAPELPGHGLDPSAPLKCAGFEEYTQINQRAHQWIKDQGHTLLVEVAHSTGAVGRMNQLLSDDKVTHKMIFLNPLVKISMFRLARFSHEMFSRFLTSLPRKKWGRGEDKEFLKFRSRDPLQPWRIPRQWPQHYFDWADKLLSSDIEHSGEQLLIITGEKDRVVNFRESEKVLSSLFPKASFSRYPNLGHQMLYGDEREVQELLSEINHWWSGAGPSSFE